MLKYIRHWSIFLLFNQIILLIGNSKVTDHHVFFDHCKFLFVCLFVKLFFFLLFYIPVCGFCLKLIETSPVGIYHTRWAPFHSSLLKKIQNIQNETVLWVTVHQSFQWKAKLKESDIPLLFFAAVLLDAPHMVWIPSDVYPVFVLPSPNHLKLPE